MTTGDLFDAATPDAGPLLSLAVELARQAGDLLLDRQAAVALAAAGTKSSVTDMVSDADRASEAQIVAGIRAARPDDAVLGEETGARDGSSGVRWIVDPLDGTTNYLYGLAGWGVSIAVVAGRETVAGVVHDPVRGETFAARRSGGATMNGSPIRCRSQADLATALVGTGFSYSADERRRQADVLAKVLGEVRDIRRFGAAAVDLCLVACGRLDAFFEAGLAPWDLAAGALIAAEAGATLGDLAGGLPSERFVLASAPGLFDPLQRLLRSAGAP